MSLPILALWFVCGLGTAILAAVAPMSRAAMVTAAASFAIGAWWAHQPFAPSVPAVALMAAVTAIWQVTRSPKRPYAAAIAGLLAGLWTTVLSELGLPTIAAIAVAATLPIASAWLSARRTAFAPPALREEALLVLGLVGLTAAALPGITDGWHAAVNLSVRGGQQSNPPADSVIPVWTLAIATAALVSGGIFSLWSRR